MPAVKSIEYNCKETTVELNKKIDNNQLILHWYHLYLSKQNADK